MKISQADRAYREAAPYLFEAEDEDEPGHEITVSEADGDGEVLLHWRFVEYVPQALRDQRQKRGYPNADRPYEWSGRGHHLTRAQALKLARQLIKAAAYEAESGV